MPNRPWDSCLFFLCLTRAMVTPHRAIFDKLEVNQSADILSFFNKVVVINEVRTRDFRKKKQKKLLRIVF